MTAQILKAIEKSPVHLFVNLLKRFYELEKLKSEIRAERDQLAKLTDQELLDMGITRSQAMREAKRKFNDIPKSRIDTNL
ncbi:MAG: DUF1127 domain-containing protein [Pseudomonadota bacterium]